MDFYDILLAKSLGGEGGGSSVDVEPLSVTENGTYEEEGKVYSPVDVNIPQPKMRKITVTNNRNTLGNANDYIAIYSFYIEEGLMKVSNIKILPNRTKDIYFPFAYVAPITPPSTTKSFYDFVARTNKDSSVPVFSDYITVSGSVIVDNIRYSICQINGILQEIPDEIAITVT